LTDKGDQNRRCELHYRRPASVAACYDASGLFEQFSLDGQSSLLPDNSAIGQSGGFHADGRVSEGTEYFI
jgi:hypothetical protein